MKIGPAARNSGFTLLEVLVAMTIVGLGVVTLLQVFSLGLRLQSRSMSRNEAIAQGSRVMDELLARKRLDGSVDGQVGRDVRWTAQIRAVADSSSELALSKEWELREVALEMSARNGETSRMVELKTFRLTRKGEP